MSDFCSFGLIILSLTVLWTVPVGGAYSTGSFALRSFEVNAMAISPQGDAAFGSFYAMDPTVIPWNLTNPIYKYAAVTLFVSNSNSSAISQLLGVNIPAAASSIIPYNVILVVQGVQRNAPAIASDLETTFSLQPGSFTALTSNPLTLPVSVFGANLTSNPYSNFVGPFVQKAGIRCRCGVLSKYTSSMLETSSSGIIFNSVESLTYPVSPFLGATGLNTALFGSEFDFAFGLNATGTFVVEKKLFDFSQPLDHTLSFGSLLGLTNGISSITNETFATILPGGALANSFSPSNMLVQSSTQATIVIGVFPWVGTNQRLLPDVSVTFHYPAFNAPVLTASWTNTPFNVGQNFTLSLTVMNQGGMDAQKLHLTLGFTGAVYWNGPRYSMNAAEYDVGTLPMGGTNTRSFKFESLTTEATFNLAATFLDTQNFAYSWTTSFSAAASIKQNGPLIVTKSVSPSNPSYGQTGTVTVSVKNTDLTSSYYNVLDLTPEAFPFLYSTGSMVTSSGTVCETMNFVEANTTYFTFQLSNSCSSAILQQVWVQAGTLPMTLVASPNLPLSSGSLWSPIPPYRFPTGSGVTLGSSFAIQLIFQNVQFYFLNSVSYTGPLPPLGNPRASYISLNCSPCRVMQGRTTFINGVLLNSTALPIAGAPIQLSYRIPSNNTLRVLANASTGSNGAYVFNWTSVGQLPIGTYSLIANFTGSAKYDLAHESVQVQVVTATIIGPGATLTLTYPYFFNATGPLTISPERVAYSSAVNATRTTQSLIGEYVALSLPVSVSVSAPPIFLVVDTATNATRLSLTYSAPNQSYVQISLTVSNSGPQTATNVAVSSRIPRCLISAVCSGLTLQVTSAGPGVTANMTRGTVSFSIASLQAGQRASFWYVVKANSPNGTDIYETASDVTGQAVSSQYRFSYTGPVLTVYSTSSTTQQKAQGFLQAFVTMNPPVIANGTSSVVTVSLFNAGNVTYTSINATIRPFGLTFDRNSSLVPNMLPDSFQTVSFTATPKPNIVSSFNPWTSASFVAEVIYNQTGTKGWHTGPSYQSVLVYDSKVAGFNPTVSVTMSATGSVSAGASDFVIVTVTNTGTVNMTNIELTVKAFSPLFNPSGVSQPETIYGGYFNTYYDNWRGNFTAGQSVKFRIGIQTRAGGLYPVFVDHANWNFAMPNTNSFSGFGQVAASNSVLITATDNTGPVVSAPWTSPFGPTSNDAVHVWASASDGSGIGSVTLEYSTDKQTWTPLYMTPLIGSYVTSQSITSVQSVFGDVYNATIPAQASGTVVYYRVRAVDRLGNSALQDNNGIDYLYSVVGSKSAVFKESAGTNVQVNVSQSIPTLRSLITFTVSTPLSFQVTQLSSNPTGVTPNGVSPLGIYASISQNCSITFDSRVRFYYSSSQVQGLNATTIAPYYWGGSGWVRLDNVVVNTGLNYTEGTAHHFSLFAVFASASSTPPPTTQPTSSSTPWLLIGAIIAVVAIAFLLAILLMKRRKRQTAIPSTQPAQAGPTISSGPMPPEPSPRPSGR